MTSNSKNHYKKYKIITEKVKIIIYLVFVKYQAKIQQQKIT